MKRKQRTGVLCAGALWLAAVGGRAAGTETDGLVARWKADGNFLDAIGECQAAPHGTVTFGPGMDGDAFAFDGGENGLTAPDRDAFHFTDALTLCLWVNVQVYPTERPALLVFRGDDRGGLDPYVLNVDTAGRANFYVTGEDNQSAGLSAPLAKGRWILLAATYEKAAGALRLYENGELVSETTTTFGPLRDLDPNASPGVGIGNHPWHEGQGFNYPFHGLLDDVRLYSRALTPAQIRALFRQATAAPSLPPRG